MGKKDDIITPYFEDPAVFSDYMNGAVFQGKQILKPEMLKPLPREKKILFNAKEKTKKSGRRKAIVFDTVKEADINGIYAVFACENQRLVDYGMPARTLLYQAVDYGEQMKELQDIHNEEKDLQDSAEFLSGMKKTDKLKPVICSVFHYGEEPWDGPLQLEDMLEIPKELELFKEYMPQYRIHLVEPGMVSPELFKGEWKLIFQTLECMRGKKDFNEYVKKHEEELNKLTLNGRRALLAMLGEDVNDIQEMEEKSMMYTSLREFHEKERAAAQAKGRAEGRAVGRAEGRAEGRTEGEQSLLKVISELMKEKNIDAINKVVADADYRSEMYKKYAIF